MIDHGQFAVPGTTPSRLVFEVASELAGEGDLPPTDSSRLSAKPSEARKDRIPGQGEGAACAGSHVPQYTRDPVGHPAASGGGALLA